MKLGLALSGGGFRASFFHIGVLAKMAEIGKLRQVEVISTVSGGSIVGAMYYIKLKKLLDNNASPTNQQLVNLVQDLEVEFLEGVQQNIRMQSLSNPLKNLRMSLANYSISDRLAELYDKKFYRPVLNPGANEMIKMRDLKICPDGQLVDPDEYNKSLGENACKLPIILINATSLNSGHNWRFEASSMGEPKCTTVNLSLIDQNFRFSKPAKYDDMPEKPSNIKLGHAVAASACVPGLFYPLAISDLYKDVRIQLVDGGVHDNQGIEALLEESCKEVIISDASGHMSDELAPSTRTHHVLARSNKILMDRVREEQLTRTLNESGIKSTLLYLRKGLAAKTIPYVNEINQEQPSGEHSIDFGVHPDIQDALSNIRTDLDSFSDIEADALMADGYLMSQHVFSEKQIIAPGQWRFSYLTGEMCFNNNKLLKHLRVADRNFLKVFFLKPIMSAALAILFTAAFIMLLFLLIGDNFRAYMNEPLEVKTNQDLFNYIIVFIFFAIVSLLLSRWKNFHTMYRLIRQPATFIGRLLARALPPALGSIFVWLHLTVFDQIFLRSGKRENFKSQIPPSKSVV